MYRSLRNSVCIAQGYVFVLSLCANLFKDLSGGQIIRNGEILSGIGMVILQHLGDEGHVTFLHRFLNPAPRFAVFHGWGYLASKVSRSSGLIRIKGGKRSCDGEGRRDSGANCT